MSEEDDKGQEKPKTSQLAIFFCGTKMKKIKIVKLFLSVVILIVLWFIAIDKSWFIEGCENCLYHRDVIKYRFFTIPIYEHSSETHTPVEIIAQALGSPCPHKNWYVRHKYRWWGLVFCVCPCESGTTGFNYDIESWYHASLREKLREASERNPTLGEEFRQRVVYKNDWDYWSRF